VVLGQGGVSCPISDTIRSAYIHTRQETHQEMR